VRLGLKRASGAVAASGAGGEPVECLEDLRGAPQSVALLVGELDEHAGGDERLRRLHRLVAEFEELGNVPGPKTTVQDTPVDPNAF
jgi:hypothetical protein